MPTLAELLQLQNNPDAYVGYPQLQRQALRMRQAQAGREAENLPDPRTYGFVRGVLGANPDELGMSVLSPNTAPAKEAAYYGAQLTNLAQMLPAAKAYGKLAGSVVNDAMVYGKGPLAAITPQTMKIVEGEGKLNQPMKGAKLVHIPIDMIEHGEAVMPGGTLTWPNARKKIEEYAAKETPIPPIDIVSPEGGSGKWMVADGSHRLEAAKLKGQKTIPAYVNPNDKEGLDMIRRQKIQAKPIDSEMRTFKTSDGYTFYELPDGKIVDNLNPEAVDMSWDSFKQLKDDFGDDVYQVQDQLGKRKAAISSTGNPNLLNDWYAFRAEPTKDELFQQALNKQNKKPNLKVIK